MCLWIGKAENLDIIKYGTLTKDPRKKKPGRKEEGEAEVWPTQKPYRAGESAHSTEKGRKCKYRKKVLLYDMCWAWQSGHKKQAYAIQNTAEPARRPTQISHRR
jgi:hypothetical protein